MSGRVVWVCGAPATGKTVLVRALAKALDLPAYGIDEERLAIMAPGEHWPANDALAWQRLASKVQQAECCLLETSGLAGKERAFLAGREVLVVLCVAHTATRSLRLLKRRQNGYRFAANNRHYVRDTLRLPAPPIRPNLVVDSTDGIAVGPIVGRVRAFVEGN